MTTEWSRTEKSWASQVPVDAIWNAISRSFLLFMFPLVNRVVKSQKYGQLERENLPGLPSTLMHESVKERIINNWNIEKKKKNPSLLFAVLKSSKPILFFGILCSSLQGLFSAVGRPLVLRSLVLGVENGMSLGEGIGMIFFFGVVAFLEGWVGTGKKRLLISFSHIRILLTLKSWPSVISRAIWNKLSTMSFNFTHYESW